MRHVYLPTEHSDTDLVLAGQIAERLESRTLYVTWSPRGYELPEVETIVRAAPPEPVPSPERADESPLHGLFTEVVGTMAALVAAIFAPRPQTPAP
jgi:hypothetical protein